MMLSREVERLERSICALSLCKSLLYAFERSYTKHTLHAMAKRMRSKMLRGVLVLA